MIKVLTFVSLFFAALLLISCNPADRPAVGPEDEIYVMADSSEFQQLEPALDSTFEKVIYTPQPEDLFTLKRISPNQLESYKQSKNLIIVAPLNSNSITSRFINAIMDTSVKAKFMEEKHMHVNKYNLWAKNQLVMILTAPTMTELRKDIMTHKDDLLYAFQKISDDRLAQSLYSAPYERQDVEGMLLKNYGWIIYVQADYQVALNIPKDNFVWLRRAPGSDMERWIFVHWIDNASPDYLNTDSIRAIRNRMTKKYYRTTDDSSYVIIAQDYFTTNEVNFKGKYAILTQGLWELNTKGMGGPFINYTFFDKKTKRIYMLDGSIFAPSYYKRNIIQQMDVTLQSFMTASELSKDRKEDLLEEAKDYKPLTGK
ncbi:MAG: DUF4837 family protein [Ignavibacteriaceae bacterium]|jgi:hypothetical protein